MSAKALAARHGLPPRHLEPVLQAFVREGILKGIRGPGGGYELAREAREISAEEILRAAGTVDDGEQAGQASSRLVSEVVIPAMTDAERAFASVLAKVSVDDMVRRATSLPG